MGFFDLFKSRSSTNTLDPMLTSEQLQAQKVLSSLASSGSYDGFNLGEGYTGSLGNFDMTGIEGMGQNSLVNLLNSGTPQGINTARNTLTRLSDTKFNPDDPSSGYAAYARQVARASGEANDALNRESAITGDRFSTSIMKNKADLGAQQSDILATKLGELYNASQNRALNASNSLVGLEGTNEDINQGRISSAYQYGNLDRLLKTAEAEAKYNEFNRARGEKLKQFDIAGNLFGKNVQFGNMSTTTEAPSIFSSIMGQTNPFIGSYNTAKYGAANAPNQAQMSDIYKMVMSKVGGGATGGGSYAPQSSTATIGNASGAGADAGWRRALQGYL